MLQKLLQVTLTVLKIDKDKEDLGDLFSQELLTKATEILGIERKKHINWSSENSFKIQSLLELKNSAYTASLINPSSVQLKKNLIGLKTNGGKKLAIEIQG